MSRKLVSIVAAALVVAATPALARGGFGHMGGGGGFHFHSGGAGVAHFGGAAGAMRLGSGSGVHLGSGAAGVRFGAGAHIGRINGGVHVNNHPVTQVHNNIHPNIHNKTTTTNKGDTNSPPPHAGCGDTNSPPCTTPPVMHPHHMVNQQQNATANSNSNSTANSNSNATNNNTNNIGLTANGGTANSSSGGNTLNGGANTNGSVNGTNTLNGGDTIVSVQGSSASSGLEMLPLIAVLAFAHQPVATPVVQETVVVEERPRPRRHHRRHVSSECIPQTIRVCR